MSEQIQNSEKAIYLFRFENLCALRQLVVQNLKSEYLNGISVISEPQSSQGFFFASGTGSGSATFIFDFFFLGRFFVRLEVGAVIVDGSGISL